MPAATWIALALGMLAQVAAVIGATWNLSSKLGAILQRIVAIETADRAVRADIARLSGAYSALAQRFEAMNAEIRDANYRAGRQEERVEQLHVDVESLRATVDRLDRLDGETSRHAIDALQASVDRLARAIGA